MLNWVHVGSLSAQPCFLMYVQHLFIARETEQVDKNRILSFKGIFFFFSDAVKQDKSMQ